MPHQKTSIPPPKLVCFVVGAGCPIDLQGQKQSSFKVGKMCKVTKDKTLQSNIHMQQTF